MSEQTPAPRDEHTPARADRLHSLTRKQAASGVAVVVVAVFALINLQDVTMHWIVGTTHTPLIVLVAICVLIGVGVGYMVGRRTRAPKKADG